ncbi:MoxR family ATPase [Paenibacillus sp. FJAT-26967]|uniref:AAA family ATPase n=1 Tax=Paenibacillus sp. FJAT-26967 TaxID=1729690 RepID=UPI000838EB15|nr:MoxR family ATPase [Paenibacillus sp. FJAT-26967]
MISNRTFLFDQPQPLLNKVVDQVSKVVFGKRDVIEKCVVAMLCGGHILLEDVPGVGKTLLVRSLAASIGCEYKRIQCTPDLMPSDITGVSVFKPQSGSFEFSPGPLMNPVVLADELNRALPRTQSAFLEAMEEKSITVDGITHELPEPFLLLATQNPLDHEGTFPLPEAQLDRFLMKLSLGYPDQAGESAMLERHLQRRPTDKLRPVLLQEEWVELQHEAAAVSVDDSLREYIVSLAAATRRHPDLRLGASPRASSALMRASQARALMQGRRYVVPDDIKNLAAAVFAHRLLPVPEARMAGRSARSAVEAAVASVPIPVLRFAAIR